MVWHPERLPIDRAMRPFMEGRAAILMFHRLVPHADDHAAFAANRGIELSMDFLQDTINYFTKRGFQWVDVHDLTKRDLWDDRKTKLAAITFDDGYRDNFSFGFDFFAERKIPYTVFICPEMLEGQAFAWWFFLEKVLIGDRRVDFSLLQTTSIGGEFSLFAPLSLKSLGKGQREELFQRLMPLMQKLAILATDRSIATQWFEIHGVDTAACSAELFASWPVVKEKLKTGCLSIGSHTMTHRRLADLSEAEVRWEMDVSRQTILAKTGYEVQSIAYPFGDARSCGTREAQVAKELGFKIGLTTRHGWLAKDPTKLDFMMLPRINVSGHYRGVRHFEAAINGYTNLKVFMQDKWQALRGYA